MKVRHLSGPKANTLEHLQPSVATMLAAAGLCEIIKPKSFAEFMREANPPAAAPTVEWGIKPAGAYTPATVIKRTSAGDLTYFRTPPPDCPTSIVAQFKQLTDGTSELPLGPNEAATIAEAYSVGDSNKHRKVSSFDEYGKPVLLDPLGFVKRQ